MTQDDVIRMAREAGLADACWESEISFLLLKRFAALVEAAVRNNVHTCHKDCQNPACVAVREAAAAEREACAKLFDGKVWAYDYREIAAAIRARGSNG
jgi:hypothetical protein